MGIEQLAALSGEISRQTTERVIRSREIKYGDKEPIVKKSNKPGEVTLKNQFLQSNE